MVQPTKTNAAAAKSAAPAKKEKQNEKPTHPEFLDGKKTLPTDGRGPGGRPWVYGRDSGIRKEQRGDDKRPLCPACTRDEVAVLCYVTSSQSATQFTKCPLDCGFSVQVTRQPLDFSPPNPFVERP